MNKSTTGAGRETGLAIEAPARTPGRFPGAATTIRTRFNELTNLHHHIKIAFLSWHDPIVDASTLSWSSAREGLSVLLGTQTRPAFGGPCEGGVDRSAFNHG